MVGLLIISIACLITGIFIAISLCDDQLGILIGILFVILGSSGTTASIIYMQDRSNSANENTKIIHRYQQSDYELEIKVNKEKVDTLYIFN